jgi:hypothetical protein
MVPIIKVHVPLQKSNFGCCSRLFGGELAVQKATLDPAGVPVS